MASVTDASPQKETDILLEAIGRGVTEAVQRAMDAEIAGLHERVVQRVRGEVGAIAARVLGHYDMTQQGRFITIRVEIEDPKSKDRT